MKIKFLKIFPISCLAFLASCSSYKLVGSVSNQNNTSITHSYYSFDGTKSYNVNLPIETPITVAVVSEQGTLSMKIANVKTNEEIYSGNFTEDFNFVVNAQPGKYKITMNAKQHRGSYSLNWNIK